MAGEGVYLQAVEAPYLEPLQQKKLSSTGWGKVQLDPTWRENIMAFLKAVKVLKEIDVFCVL